MACENGIRSGRQQIRGFDMSDAAIIEARAVTKEFRRRDRVLTQVLRGVDLAVPAGQIVGIHGAVASGKTTLLRLFAALERPTSGDILYAGRPLWSHTWRGWRPSTPRRGFALPVFKNAVASLDPSWPLWRTVTEAACLAGVVRTRALAERQRLATDLLARVGLSREQINDAPKHLSASQCQQVAIHERRCVFQAKLGKVLVGRFFTMKKTRPGGVPIHCSSMVRREFSGEWRLPGCASHRALAK